MKAFGELPELGLAWLGQRPYEEILAAQERLVSLRQRGEIGDLLLLLEHSPVLTLGRRTEPGDLLHDRGFYEDHGIAVEPTPRGGKVTYHGPGQLVAYPIVDLRGISRRRGKAGQVEVAWFVEVLETAMVRALGRWRVAAGRIEGLTGLWVDRDGPLPVGATAASTAAGVASGRIRKIGSIGLRVSRGVSSHGLAINVDGDLTPFGWINSCGIEHCAVTSIAEQVTDSSKAAGDRSGPGTAYRTVPGPEGLGIAVAEELAELLGRDLEPVDPVMLGLAPAG
ncbi:MAG: lipoyl(octanoyl) transferase LipB [Solirubrobacterales bacterium]|nr:lipoyl(octanoyl) transferase LipB [Solirubrobacterales bacterium]